MWTEATRPKYVRAGLRYASDMTDAEWAVIAPMLPKPKRRGRPRQVDLRAVVDALFYLLRAGCPWRLLPKCFPRQGHQVRRCFRARCGWRDRRLCGRQWRRSCRRRIGREGCRLASARWVGFQ